MEKMLISIVITTKNEEKNIRNCLESVKGQNFNNGEIEIIVVDNKSIDATKNIAREYTDKIYDFGPERSAQRNFGVKQSRGKYILYLDADMILSENVVKECVVKCEQERFVALYIPEKIMGDSFWNKVRGFERSFYDATVIDCVRFVSKEVFDKVKGFDESLTGPEDWDFDRKVRNEGAVGLIKSVLHHNEGEFNLGKYLKKKGYYSQSFGAYISKWGINDPTIKKQLGFWYRYFGVFVEQGKWKRLILNPFYTVGMYFLRFLVGIVFVVKRLSQKHE